MHTVAWGADKLPKSADVLALMERVADWQLAHPAEYPPTDWTQAAGYAGIMALARISSSPRFEDAMMDVAEHRTMWQLGPRPYHADDHAVGQMYAELFFRHRDPKMIAPMRERFDWIRSHPKEGSLEFVGDDRGDRWAWCDSLFMAPPAWTRLYAATHDSAYRDYMVTNWWRTSDYLYDKSEHLYFRDSTYFEKRENNGHKVFWSRGNGWVMAGLARVLEYLPQDDAARPRFVQQFREMADRIIQLQQPDGLWRSSLLDPKNYPLKETSGSGFYVFALAWGVNHELLDRRKFQPAILKGWAALVASVQEDGKLTHVQPIGEDPRRFDESHSDVYGVGAFLLAGSEVYRLSGGTARNRGPAETSATPPPAAAKNSKVYARFVPERMDDFAWENDRIAFRMYGPALIKGEGTISSGIDVWAKRTPRLVINEWYAGDDYHRDHGEGLDFYNVRTSRGCGGLGIWEGGKLYTSSNFASWRVLENGPKRVVFELTYAPWDVNGRKVSEVKRISLDAGSHFNRIESTFQSDTPGPLTVGIGIATREGGDWHEEPAAGWFSYWEPESPPNGHIACAVIAPGAIQRFETTPTDRLALVTAEPGKPLAYSAGAAWSKSGEFADAAAWNAFIRQRAAKK
jgi:rhamnogalacturonyl hydrolase YesR